MRPNRKGRMMCLSVLVSGVIAITIIPLAALATGTTNCYSWSGENKLCAGNADCATQIIDNHNFCKQICDCPPNPPGTCPDPGCCYYQKIQYRWINNGEGDCPCVNQVFDVITYNSNNPNHTCHPFGGGTANCLQSYQSGTCS
jgi:hypothetical protein